MKPLKIIQSEAQDEAATNAHAAQLAHAMMPGAVIYLNGSLGAGKTTWTRGFLRALGYQDKVKSPTYTLVEPYHTDQYEVFHFDLYRLKSPEELLQIGLEEYFNQHAVCLIEWPDKGGAHLPKPDLIGYFDIIKGAASKRSVRFEAYTARGEEILARL